MLRAASHIGTRAALVALAVAAVGAGMVLFTVLARVAPRTDYGPLLDWLPGYPVGRARVLGVEVYVDVSSSREDKLTGIALGATSALTAWVAARLWRARLLQQAARFGLLAGGAFFLAIDELLAVHETVGMNLAALRHLPAVSHPDDVIIGMYAVVAVVFAWWARPVLRESRWARSLLLAGLLVAIAAAGQDLKWLPFADQEERLEFVAVALLLAGLLVLALAHLRRAREVKQPGA